MNASTRLFPFSPSALALPAFTLPALALPALALLAALLPAAAFAAPRTTELVFLGEDGVPGDSVTAYDMQVSLSGGSDGGIGGDLRNQASLTLDTELLRNPAVLGWISQCSETSGLLARVTTAAGTDTYLLNGIGTCNLSVSQSNTYGGGQVSLSLGARHLVLNGFTMN